MSRETRVKSVIRKGSTTSCTYRRQAVGITNVFPRLLASHANRKYHHIGGDAEWGPF